LDVRRKVAGRWVAAGVVLAIAMSPAAAGANPSAPGQAEPDTDERTAREQRLVNVDALVATNAPAVALTLGDLSIDVSNQLAAYNAARDAVAAANQVLADADAALTETQFLIEETTTASDEVVIDAFITPPGDNALAVLSAENLTEATIEQTLLEMDADESAEALTGLQEALAQYEELRAAQEDALEAAEDARADAETAFADLESTLSAQAQFVTQVQNALANQAGLTTPTDPAEAAAKAQREAEIMAALNLAVEQRQAAESARQAEIQRQQRIEAGDLFCPVDGPVEFTNSWGAARSGGRSHKGVDMMASAGTPTVAPVSGEVQHRGSSLGGLSWYVYGDNGNTYYGTHLAGYANQGAGWVEAGTVIGYVGATGNATGPHVHLEVRPHGGGLDDSVDPFTWLTAKGLKP
jgi:murein DD-endopeptidase MepM/ murein hydrolase activator NlpD